MSFTSSRSQAPPDDLIHEQQVGLNALHGMLATNPTRGYVAYAAARVVVLWDYKNDLRLNLTGHSGPAVAACFSADGLFLATAQAGATTMYVLLLFVPVEGNS